MTRAAPVGTRRYPQPPALPFLGMFVVLAGLMLAAVVLVYSAAPLLS